MPDLPEALKHSRHAIRWIALAEQHRDEAARAFADGWEQEPLPEDPEFEAWLAECLSEPIK